MAFCNSCGATITPGTRFCNKCGAAILVSLLPPAAPSPVPPAPSTAPVAPPPPSGGALRAILIVVGVIILVGILGLLSLGFFAWRVARHARIRQNGDNVRTLNFETSDSVDKVCSFYKPKFPNAMVMTNDANQCSIVSNDQKNMITITVKGESDKTRIVITNLNKSGSVSPSSN